MTEVNFESSLLLVLTTESDIVRAENLAKSLLEKRLVACASFHDVCSLYWWKGNLEKSKEVQLLLKTTPNRLQELSEAVHELHSYQTPELIIFQTSASQNYLEWVKESVAIHVDNDSIE